MNLIKIDQNINYYPNSNFYEDINYLKPSPFNVEGDDLENILNDNDTLLENPNEDIIKENYLIEHIKENNQTKSPKISLKIDKKKEISIDKNNINNRNKNGYKKIFLCKEIDRELPPHYFYFIIKEKIFPKLKIKKEIKESFILNENLLNLEKAISDNTYFSKKTRKRGLLKPKEDLKKKRGRKKIDDHSNSNHNKESQDNIIKKIKSKLFEYLLKFINSLLNIILKNNLKYFNHNENKREEKEQLIKKIEYKKIVDDTQRKNNLKFLKMPLKDLFSNNISPKYSTKNKNLNKNIINELLTKEKDNEIIMFVLNMTFGDWLDIFIYKKELSELKLFNIDNYKIKIISDSFERIDKLLDEIYNLNFGNNYFSSFVYLIYNYERWFFIKQGRKRRNNKKAEEK